MGLENFILACEKDNEQLRKDIDYYKNCNKRLKNNLQQKDKVIDECIELLDYYYISNMKYKDSQEEFKKLLGKLKQAKGEQL